MMTTLRRVTASRGLVLAGMVFASLALLTGCPSGTPPGGDGTTPTIALSPTSLTFTGFEFGTAPADQTIQITNSGVDTLTWSVTDNAAWLSVSPSSGTTTAETDALTVSVSTVGLTAAASPYTAQITVDAAGASNTPQTVNVTLTLSPLTCEALSGTISVDTTLSAPCYLVEGDVGVSGGATVTINPGVTLRFEQDRRMTVWNDGRLSAVGTATQPITFTSAEAIRGYWDGLYFYQSNSTSNQLDYVTIEYGGGGGLNGALELNGSGSSPARLSVSNCTLRESDTYGLYTNRDVIIENFGGNTLTANTLGAGSVAPDVAGYLDDTSTYVGNDVDQLVIQSGTVSSTQTWPAIDADYFVEGDVGVSGDTLLTIAAGARLVFGQSIRLTVWNDGRLAAVGTETDPIVLTAEEATRGYWDGLYFYQSNSLDNALDYVTIEYGGGGGLDGCLELSGSGSSPVRLSLSNCTLRESETYGFYANRDVIVENFAGNTLTANTLGAGSVAPGVAGYLDDTSTYVGNDVDQLAIRSGTVSSTQTWPGIDAEYFMEGDVGVSGGALLTIAAGAQLVFGQSIRLTVWNEGRLAAVGTETDPILMTGGEPTAGYWDGLYYYQSNSSDNRLTFVTIEYAGSGGLDGNLELTGSGSSPARLTVTDCTFRHSATWGIYLNSDTNVNADIETANTFSDNASGAVFTAP